MFKRIQYMKTHAPILLYHPPIPPQKKAISFCYFNFYLELSIGGMSSLIKNDTNGKYDGC